ANRTTRTSLPSLALHSCLSARIYSLPKPCRLAGGRGVWLQQFLSEHEVRSRRSEVRFWRHDTRCFRWDSGDAPWLAPGLVAFLYLRINPPERSRFPWCVALQIHPARRKLRPSRSVFPA